MNKDEYQVEGNKASAKKLVYVYIFITAWPAALYLLQFFVIDCSLGLSTCSKEEIYNILYIQTLAPLPLTLFITYIGYYSLKVLLQKQIPPKGNNFPYTINRVIGRDHYTFGVTGILISLLAIYLFIDYVYFTIKITSI